MNHSDFKQLLAKFPQRLEAPYATSEPNETVLLHSGHMLLRQNGRETEPAPGRIFLKWQPRPRAWFEIDHLSTPINLDSAELWIPSQSKSYPASVLGVTLPLGPCRGSIHDDGLPNENPLADSLLFHVPNFHPYMGEDIRDRDCTSVWKDRLTLSHDSWTVALDEVPLANKLRKSLYSDGGYAITNVGCLRRPTGSHFPLQEAQKILEALFYFLSFARGIWCGPVLPVALDSGIQVWAQWEPHRLREWRDRRSWFPHLEFEQSKHLSKAFSGCCSLWDNPIWTEPLKNAIHWYIEANMDAGGAEGGIILSQTALELLSWVYIVEDESTKNSSARQFEKKSAGDQIKDLLQRLGIPTDIPKELTSLRLAASALDTSGGPGTLAWIRNALVHPKKPNRDKMIEAGTSARIEAMTLGLWYLELSLLRLFGYDGLYYSRLRSGNNAEIREAVPWN